MISSADFKCSSSAIIQKTTLNIIKKTINTILATIFNQAARRLSNILEYIWFLSISSPLALIGFTFTMVFSSVLSSSFDLLLIYAKYVWNPKVITNTLLITNNHQSINLKNDVIGKSFLNNGKLVLWIDIQTNLLKTLEVKQNLLLVWMM